MIVGIINSVIKINANFIPSKYPFCFVFVPKYIELISVEKINTTNFNIL